MKINEHCSKKDNNKMINLCIFFLNKTATALCYIWKKIKIYDEIKELLLAYSKYEGVFC